MTHDAGKGWPPKWFDLDDETIELIAQLDDEKRRRFKRLVSLSDKKLDRFERIIELDDDKWDALFRIANKVVLFGNFTRSLAWIVSFLAAAIIGGSKLWEIFKPYILGGRP